MFAYCLNNPVNGYDPEGEKIKSSEDNDSEDDSEEIIFSIYIDTDVELALFDSVLSALAIGNCLAAYSAVVGLLALAPETGGASLVVAIAVLDAIATGAITTTSAVSVLCAASSKYEKNGYVTIEVYVPKSSSSFWGWLIDAGVRVQ